MKKLGVLAVFLLVPIMACAPEQKMEKSAKEAVRLQLKDPDSAQFKNVFVRAYQDKKVVCGEVNAKNAFGAYVGFNQFMYIESPYPKAVSVPITEPLSDEMEMAYSKAWGMGCNFLSEEEYQRKSNGYHDGKRGIEKDLAEIDKLKRELDKVALDDEKKIRELIERISDLESGVELVRGSLKSDYYDIRPFKE